MSDTDFEINGTCAAGFEPVRDAFAANFAERDEIDSSGRLISAKTLEAARASQGRHTDLVLGFPLEFGLGFGLSGPEGHFGPNPAAFGHDGFGGSAVGADPEAGVAFAYVMNRMGMNLVDDPRKMTLIDAVYRSLAAR
jgi:CubicO group peptidase (beta-lactamase class C family)